MIQFKAIPKLTVTLIAISALATLWVKYGDAIHLMRPLLMTGFETDTLPEISNGQVWRLFTPILLHFSIFHLALNGAGMFLIGGPIEVLKGPVVLGVLVLVCGVVSNLAQFYLGASTPPSLFGGLSGVIYALFGYLWMHSVFNHTLNLNLPKQFVVIMLLWLVLCWIGVIPNVANWAHTAGLICGLIIGVLHARLDVFRVARSVRRKR